MTVTYHRDGATNVLSVQPRDRRLPMTDAITIRHSTEEDRDALVRLAALDSQDAPDGEALVAYVDGELRAAVPLARHADPVADPFHRTRDVVELLRFRAAQEGLPA
jgi:hypothetical protein